MSECGHSGCGRPAKASGLCKSHYNQVRRGASATSDLRPYAKTANAGDGLRRCSRCGARKSEAEFYANAKRPGGRSAWCAWCDRDARLTRNYGIGAARFDKIMSEQGGVCVICRRRSDRMHVDHDHSCCPSPKRSCGNCVRGILCEDCNRALGMFRDDPETIRRALEYVSG